MATDFFVYDSNHYYSFTQCDFFWTDLYEIAMV